MSVNTFIAKKVTSYFSSADGSCGVSFLVPVAYFLVVLRL